MKGKTNEKETVTVRIESEDIVFEREHSVKEYTKFAEKAQTNEEMQKLCSAFKEKCDKNCYFA